VPLPNYGAVLSLLVIRESIEIDDASAREDAELEPEEFTLNRNRWPTKR
jgi:hypothetical protein